MLCLNSCSRQTDVVYWTTSVELKNACVQFKMHFSSTAISCLNLELQTTALHEQLYIYLPSLKETIKYVLVLGYYLFKTRRFGALPSTEL